MQHNSLEGLALGVLSRAHPEANIQRSRFVAAVRALLDWLPTWDGEHDTMLMVRARLRKVRPDAFSISVTPDMESAAVVTLYEIEASHPIDRTKMANLVNLYWTLEYHGVLLKLVVANRYGVGEHEIPLAEIAWAEA